VAELVRKQSEADQSTTAAALSLLEERSRQIRAEMSAELKAKEDVREFEHPSICLVFVE
jgi:hypothetical protein